MEMCVKCNEKLSHCRHCTVTGGQPACTDCEPGFFVDSRGTCKSCGEQHTNCLECSSADKCDKCDTKIASLNGDGKCLQCKEGWELNKDKTQCVCKQILNTQEGYQCQKCDTLIENCGKC